MWMLRWRLFWSSVWLALQVPGTFQRAVTIANENGAGLKVGDSIEVVCRIHFTPGQRKRVPSREGDPVVGWTPLVTQVANG